MVKELDLLLNHLILNQIWVELLVLEFGALNLLLLVHLDVFDEV